jgi:CCR4-NOT complex subunit CAF16
MAALSSSPAIQISHMSFKYERSQALHDISLTVPRGARMVLLGANGAGKSSTRALSRHHAPTFGFYFFSFCSALLRIIGGKHMILNGTVETLGQPAFRTDHSVEFLGSTWSRTVAFAGNNVSYQADIPVSEMSIDLQNEHPERRDYLYNLLEVDPLWRMHELSDGQRRRVQLLLGLLRPFDLLVLDEITVDLDVITRQDFMNFLKQECEQRNATVIYATHIFDGLDDWATDLAYLSYGRLTKFGPMSSFDEITELVKNGIASPLLKVCLHLLFIL